MFGDIHALSQKAAQAFKGMIENSPEPETKAEPREPTKKPVALVVPPAPAQPH
jgi:hypothetical protein